MIGHRPKMSVFVYVLALAAGLVSGVSLASDCDGWYCADPVLGCVQHQEFMTDLCCRDEDGNNISHCITCDRHEYTCDDSTVYGPAMNCRNPEAVCQ